MCNPFIKSMSFLDYLNTEQPCSTYLFQADGIIPLLLVLLLGLAVAIALYLVAASHLKKQQEAERDIEHDHEELLRGGH